VVYLLQGKRVVGCYLKFTTSLSGAKGDKVVEEVNITPYSSFHCAYCTCFLCICRNDSSNSVSRDTAGSVYVPHLVLCGMLFLTVLQTATLTHNKKMLVKFFPEISEVFKHTKHRHT